MGKITIINLWGLDFHVCDTGLFITLAFWDKKFTENIIYEKLLSDKLPAMNSIIILGPEMKSITMRLISYYQEEPRYVQLK